MNYLAILGASGHGKVVADTAEQTGVWDKILFFDDKWPDCRSNGQWEVVGNFSSLLSSISDFHGVLVAIGNNRIREKKQLLLLSQQANLTTLIHPKSYVSPSVELGVGTVIFANAVVNIDSVIGAGCIINTGAVVDHDCQLADFVHISPGAHLAGAVTIGARSWVGIGASVIQEIRIDNDVVVGAGSSVIHDVVASTTVAGSPAKSL